MRLGSKAAGVFVSCALVLSMGFSSVAMADAQDSAVQTMAANSGSSQASNTNSSASNTNNASDDEVDEVEAYVTRLYELVLGRTPEQKGLDAQCEAMYSGTPAGEIALNFFSSTEFANMGLSDSEVVDRVYAAMFDREADADGKAMWLGYLENGCSVKSIVVGFIESNEFIYNCKRWGVDPGNASELRETLESRDQNPNATAFVARLYQYVLDRTPDADGLNTQTAALIKGESSAQIADNFFISEEFTNMGLTRSESVEKVYLTMLDRASDSDGLSFWVSKLDSGVSIESVVAGFAQSVEFSNLCAKWALAPGTVTLTKNRDLHPGVASYVARLYTEALGRSFDEEGMEHFCTEFDNNLAVDVITTFYSCDEFTSRGLSNADAVKAVYRGVFGRDADDSGLATWAVYLDQGNSVSSLIAKLCATDEFDDVANTYGLSTMDAAARAAYQVIKNMSSSTGYLLALSLNDYTIYCFQGSAGNWKLVREMPCGVGLGTPEWGATFRGTFFLATWVDWDWGTDGLIGPRDPEPDGWGVVLYSAMYASQGFHSTVGDYSDPSQVYCKISHGCIRTFYDNAAFIYDLPVGTTIYSWGTIYD